MRLPAPDATAESRVTFIDTLEDGCTRDPNRAAWETNKQRWMDLYTGNHFSDPLVSSAVGAGRLEPELRSAKSASTVCQLVYNRVMNAVLAMLAGQISNPPKVVFSGRENGDPPIYYLNGFIQNPALQQIAMIAGQEDDRAQQLAEMYGPDHPQVQQAVMQAGQSVPLPPDLVDQVRLLIDNGKMMQAQARLAGMPPPIGIVPPEALVEITDQSTAQFTQTIYDGLWEQCGGIEATAENILNKKVLGWQPTLFESDRTKIAYGESPITLTNVEGTQILFDPATSSFRPPRYVIMREPVTYQEAMADPEIQKIADKIKSAFVSGPLNARNGYGGRLFDMDSVEDRCIVRTLWHADWPYPMSPDEALACGKVSIKSVPTGENAPVSDPETGEVIGQQPMMRQTMVSGETGEQDIHPQHPSWPIIYAWREVREIGGEIVFDRRCKTPFAPVVNNINIPIPFSPYGYGEPDRLDGLQMAINRVLSDMVEYHRFNAYPLEVCHEAVGSNLSGPLSKMRKRPNTLVKVPADLANQVGGDLSKLVQYVPIPPMNADAWQLLEFLVEAIDKEANNSDVQNGEAPAGSSGQWVANLQAAASQVAQVTSQATEAWLKKIVRLFVNFITNEMTVEDVQKYTSKYPPAILEAFKRRQKTLYIDIGVEIQSGSAAAKSGQTASMIQARAAGITISEPDILDRMGIDPDDTLKRESDWMQKKVDSGLIQQQVEQTQQSGAGEKKKPADAPAS